MNNLILTLLASLIFLLSCQSNNAVSDEEDNKKIILQYHDIWNSGETEKLNEIMTTDFVCHFLSSGEWKGIEGAKTEIANWKQIFPDWHEEVVDIITEKDKVVTRYKSTGTHSGTFEGIDSTGIKIEIYEVSIYRLSEGRLAEQWCFPDDVSLKNQLLKSQ
ncbi:MAG: ester cyclase [Cyclobacteriaceae bacterium]|nr:ester cyclase [Cyclobacteriaceae bacterium]